MAEIKIEKKKSIWPWILVALAFLALLYFLFFSRDEEVYVTENEMEMITDDTEVIEDERAVMLSKFAVSEIMEYVIYVSNDAEMGLDHEYANGALTKLIDATEALANTLDVNIDADLAMARTQAKSITKDPYEVDHADKIRNAGSSIANAIEKIQMQKFPNMGSSVTELQNSVMAIVPETKTLNQKAEVKRFFDQAAGLLTNMKNI